MWTSTKKAEKLIDSDSFIDLLSPSKKSTLYIHKARFWNDNELVFPEDKCYCSVYQVLFKNCTQGDLFYGKITCFAINLAYVYSDLQWKFDVIPKPPCWENDNKGKVISTIVMNFKMAACFRHWAVL